MSRKRTPAPPFDYTIDFGKTDFRQHPEYVRQKHQHRERYETR
jgi:hypothetical protein